MKRTLIISIFLAAMLMMPGFILAQQVNYGVKGGFTLSNLYINTDELDDENARIGFHGGLFSQYMLMGTFGIQPEFLFTTKGSEGNYSGLIDQTVNFNINYIDIPILAVLKPIGILEIHAGPYLGILLNSNVKYSGFINGEYEIDREHLNSFDYGLAAGVALNFGYLQAGLRYNLGLQTIADSDASRLLLGDSKNSYGQLFIALRLDGR